MIGLSTADDARQRYPDLLTENPHPRCSRNSPWGRRCVVVWWVLLAGHADLRPLGGPDGSGDGQEEFRRGGSDRAVRALGGREVSGADRREPGIGPQNGP